jgi:hypothetical protein
LSSTQRRVRWIGVYRRALYAAVATFLLLGGIWLGWGFWVGAVVSFIFAVFTDVADEMKKDGEDPWGVWS